MGGEGCCCELGVLPFLGEAELDAFVGGVSGLEEAGGARGLALFLSAVMFSIVQLAARASFWVRSHVVSAKVRIVVGLALAAVAVAWLVSASPRNRNTPPPPRQATAYTIFKPRFCMRLIEC